MQNESTEFPQYRILDGRKVFYKILSNNEFIELSWIGERAIVHRVVAQQYPEKLRIMDMLKCEAPFSILIQAHIDLMEETIGNL